MTRIVTARVLVAAMLGAFLLACASTAPERRAASLARYEAAAGAPVDRFRFFRFSGFTVLGDEALAVWTGPSRRGCSRSTRPAPSYRGRRRSASVPASAA